MRDTDILVEHQPPQGAFVCDRACRVINQSFYDWSNLCPATDAELSAKDMGWDEQRDGYGVGWAEGRICVEMGEETDTGSGRAQAFKAKEQSKGIYSSKGVSKGIYRAKGQSKGFIVSDGQRDCA